MKSRTKICFYLNSQKIEVEEQHSHMMLADYLRQVRLLTGTKIVCAEGDCGACTILKYEAKANKGKAAFVPINSCITWLFQLDGASLLTVEALGASTPSRVQSAIYDCHASQCGYCTPGFVMALTGLVEKRVVEKEQALIRPQEAKNAMTGNLCRCTGYEALVNAACSINLSKEIPLKKTHLPESQLKELTEISKSELLLEGKGFKCFLPKSMKQALAYYGKERNCRIVSGASDLGVQNNKGKHSFGSFISLQKIAELQEISFDKKNRIKVGASVSLAQLREVLKEKHPVFSSFLDIFASPQIKNVATLVGNVVNASPIADTPPFLLVSNAVLCIKGPKLSKEIPLTKFYKAYKKTALQKNEIVTHVIFDLPTKGAQLKLEKISERKDLDISCVNAAFWADLDSEKRVKEFRIALGGVSATPLRISKVEEEIEGQMLSLGLIKKVSALLEKELHPLSDLRGSAEYRRLLASVLLSRFLKSLLDEGRVDVRAET